MGISQYIKEISRGKDGARAILSAADFLDVLADSHGSIVFLPV